MSFSKESWYYTKPDSFLKGMELPSAIEKSGSLDSLPREVVRLLQGFENKVIFYNGNFCEALSSYSSDILGVLSRDEYYCENPLDELNETQAESGYNISLDAGSASSNLAIVFLYGNRLDDETRSFRSIIRNQLKISGQGNANVLEMHIAVNEIEFFINHSLYTELDEGSSCSRMRYFWIGGKAFLYDQHQSRLAAEAKLKNVSFVTGGKWTRFNEEVFLADKKANAELSHMCLLGGGQSSDLYSKLHHAVGETNTNQQHKSLLTGKSKSSFTGTISIAEDAQKSVAAQVSHNLVLDDECEVNTRPQLQVLADDVKANHGATVGQLSEDEIFYLQSRSISAEKARQLVARGIVFSTLNIFDDGVLKNSSRQCLEASLQQFMREAHLD